MTGFVEFETDDTDNSLIAHIVEVTDTAMVRLIPTERTLAILSAFFLHEEIEGSRLTQEETKAVHTAEQIIRRRLREEFYGPY